MKTELVVLEQNDPLPEDDKVSRYSLCSVEGFKHLLTRPWLGWVFVYSSVVLFCSMYRCATLCTLLSMYGTKEDDKFWIKVPILCLGFLEDFVCATYLAFVLWLIDTLHQRFSTGSIHLGDDQAEVTETTKLYRVASMSLIFLSSWTLFVAVVGPVAADFLLVRLRGIRFTFHLVTAKADNSPIDAMTSEEMNKVCVAVVITAVVGGLFAVVRTFPPWSKLSSPTQSIVAFVTTRLRGTRSTIRSMSIRSSCVNADDDDGMEEIMLELEEKFFETTTFVNLSPIDLVTSERLASPTDPQENKEQLIRRGIQFFITFVALIIVPVVVVAISKASSSLVAYSSLNATLNELFAHALGDTAQSIASVDTARIGTYVHSTTENYSLSH